MTEPSFMSYSAGICACGTGEQWQRALALLSDLLQGDAGTSVSSYSARNGACEAMAAVSVAAHWAAAGTPACEHLQYAPVLLSEPRRGHAGAQRHQPQR